MLSSPSVIAPQASGRTGATAARMARNVGLFARDLIGYGARTGRWWLVAALVVIVAATALATATAKVVVPVAIYTLS